MFIRVNSWLTDLFKVRSRNLQFVNLPYNQLTFPSIRVPRQVLQICIRRDWFVENCFCLDRFLSKALKVLKPAGRLAIIEYHSLEARLIKDYIYRETHPCTCPKELPQCVCGKEPRIRVVKKLVKPSEKELIENPSARSARLRVIEKLA